MNKKILMLSTIMLVSLLISGTALAYNYDHWLSWDRANQPFDSGQCSSTSCNIDCPTTYSRCILLEYDSSYVLTNSHALDTVSGGFISNADVDNGDYWEIYEAEQMETPTWIFEAPEDPDFLVGFNSDNSPVEYGNTYNIDVDVDNVGTSSGSDNVDLLIDGVEEDTQTLTLDKGETQTITLSWSTTSSDVGTHDVEVQGTADTFTTTMEVTETIYEIDGLSDNAPIDETQTYSITADLFNSGNGDADKDVWLNIDGTEVDRANSVDIAPSSTGSVTLEWVTTDGDEGSHTAEVCTPDECQSTSFNVEPASSNFEITRDSDNSPVPEGETYQLQATVTNTGAGDGTNDAWMNIDGTEVDRVNDIYLQPSESTTITLEWSATSGEVGQHTVEMNTPHDSGTFNMNVTDTPIFRVGQLSDNSPVYDNENYTIDAQITNEGDVSYSKDVFVRVETIERDRITNFTLNSGETATATLSFNTSVLGTGNYTAYVCTVDSCNTTNFTVQSVPTWGIVETKNYTIYGSAWDIVETKNYTISSSTWSPVELKNYTIYASEWTVIELKNYTINSTDWRDDLTRHYWFNTTYSGSLEMYVLNTKTQFNLDNFPINLRVRVGNVPLYTNCVYNNEVVNDTYCEFNAEYDNPFYAFWETPRCVAQEDLPEKNISSGDEISSIYCDAKYKQSPDNELRLKLKQGASTGLLNTFDDIDSGDYSYTLTETDFKRNYDFNKTLTFRAELESREQTVVDNHSFVVLPPELPESWSNTTTTIDELVSGNLLKLEASLGDSKIFLAGLLIIVIFVVLSYIGSFPLGIGGAVLMSLFTTYRGWLPPIFMILILLGVVLYIAKMITDMIWGG